MSRLSEVMASRPMRETSVLPEILYCLPGGSLNQTAAYTGRGFVEDRRLPKTCQQSKPSAFTGIGLLLLCDHDGIHHPASPLYVLLSPAPDQPRPLPPSSWPHTTASPHQRCERRLGQWHDRRHVIEVRGAVPPRPIRQVVAEPIPLRPTKPLPALRAWLDLTEKVGGARGGVKSLV